MLFIILFLASRFSIDPKIRPLACLSPVAYLQPIYQSYEYGRCADVILEVKDSEKDSTWEETRLGSFGMLHPEVLKAFELRDPSSAVEMDLEPLM